MAQSKYPAVPEQTIVSIDVPNMGAGLFLNGAQNGPVNSIVEGKDVELTTNGYIVPRRKLVPFLPDTVETTYQKYPVFWNNDIYYFTADAGKVKFCREGDATWTNCGGSNTITTNNGGMPTFLRVLDNVFILNGKNGDKLGFVNLSGTGFPVVKYTLVDDPTTAPSAALTNLTAGAFNVYYAFTYSGTVGETALSPILTQNINVVRDQWTTQTSKGSIKLTRTGTVPTGAQYWNLYIAVASTAGTIQTSDMLQLASKLDLATTDFIDDGTLSINLGGPAPDTNSTDGPRVDLGIVEDGNPILYGDRDNLYNIWIGGGGPNAMSFSTANNGYRAEPEKGTNFYPTAIVGFRNGQGIPSLTVLYSNTEGLSKQAALTQQTINYGDQSFTVWGVTEQHYGAAGVAAPYSAINYNGKLLFLSNDGFMSAETQPTIQNVLSIVPTSTPVDPLIRSFKNSAVNNVIGTGWNNKYMWLVPSNGFDTPQQILVLDTNNRGSDGRGAWYTLDIPANWIGVVSPQNDAAFVYISQGKHTYKLLASDSTYDVKGGVNTPFSAGARGSMIGMGQSNAHNVWQADVQAIFYIRNFIGKITVGITYRGLNGREKTKTRTYDGPTFTPSSVGGYGDPQWTYGGFPQVAGYISEPAITDTSGVTTSSDVRIPVRIDDIMNEAQWFFQVESGYNNFEVRTISYEGINLGIRPDLQ